MDWRLIGGLALAGLMALYGLTAVLYPDELNKMFPGSRAQERYVGDKAHLPRIRVGGIAAIITAVVIAATVVAGTASAPS